MPDRRPYCSPGEYYLQFPDGGVDYNRFTLEVVRETKGLAGRGRATLRSNINGTNPHTNWDCHKRPATGQSLACNYDGVLRMKLDEVKDK